MIITNRIVKRLLAFAVTTLICAQAVNLQSAELTVSGANGATDIVISDAELQALPQVTFTANTPWTDAPTTFQGPTLWSLLESVDALDEPLQLVALNDYRVNLDPDRVTRDWPIVARLLNGSAMSVRDKGPYWIVFPYDQAEFLQSETFYALSIWQLSEIHRLGGR